MTVNYNFDLEDDDFFDETFLSISENDLLTSTAIPQMVCDQETNTSNTTKPTDFPQANTSSSSVCGIEDNSKRHDLCKKKTFCERAEDEVYLSPIPSSRRNSTSNVSSRFTPGFTPQTKKRKFPGPAGICTQQNNLKFLPCDLEEDTKKAEEELEILGIPNSQLSIDDLLLPSWQNLQKDVSSCPALLSTAKHYSIRRVLNETSKKKLPKHIDVPVLCVLIKKCKLDDSSLLFMDDTGEIPGKLYSKVSDTYKGYIKAGTALILRRVTFVCNVLILQEKCLACIYLEDGSVKYIHELNSILDKEEPLKPMSCEYPGTPKKNKTGAAAILEMCDSVERAHNSSNEIVHSKSHVNLQSVIQNNCASPSLKTLPSAQPFPKSVSCSPSSEVACRTLQGNSNVSKTHNGYNCDSALTKTPSDTLQFSKLQTSNALSGPSSNPLVKQSVSDEGTNCTILPVSSSLSVNESVTSTSRSVAKNPIETDPFCDGSDMDEFDELLCTLDEKSFLDEI